MLAQLVVGHEAFDAVGNHPNEVRDLIRIAFQRASHNSNNSIYPRPSAGLRHGWRAGPNRSDRLARTRVIAHRRRVALLPRACAKPQFLFLRREV